MLRRKEFESRLDIEKTLNLCREIGENDDDDDDSIYVPDVFRQDPDPFRLLADEERIANQDISNAALSKLGAVVKKREDVLRIDKYYELMRLCNKRQRRLLTHCIYHLLTPSTPAFQIFFTGAEGCGKTFIITLLKDIYNRFCPVEWMHNAFICAASTGKAAVAIDGLTVQTALKISIHKFTKMSYENIALYRTLFKNVKILTIDEASKISNVLFKRIHVRLTEMTCLFGV